MELTNRGISGFNLTIEKRKSDTKILIFLLSNGLVKQVNKAINLILLLSSSYSFAQIMYNPIQEPDQSIYMENLDVSADPEWSSQLKEKFSKVRVKIFPHNSKYAAPQGKDIIINTLTISSEGTCNIYKSEYPTSEQELTRNILLKSGNNFVLSTDTVTDPIWIECTQPIEVKRPDFPANPINYQGTLFVKTVKTGSPYLTAVNVLPFEQYLKGVVPSEMPASWALEALKAQAIAARTYAYYELGTNVASRDKNILLEQSGAQIDDTVTYQAYLGLKNGTTATNNAIDETSGIIMTHNNKVIKAYFSADSGGHTENSENVWGDFHPYVIGKKEIYPDGTVPNTNWSYVAKVKDLGTKLIAAGFLSIGDELESLFIDANDLFPSTRPRYVEIKLTNGTTKKITAVDYSFATRIKSAWINFSPASDPNNIIVSGKGYGHGVGMSQWGAKIMVDKLKKNTTKFLSFIIQTFKSLSNKFKYTNKKGCVSAAFFIICFMLTKNIRTCIRHLIRLR